MASFALGMNRFVASRGAHWLYQLLRLMLVATFLLSGATKALQPDVFANTIAAYGLLPDGLIVPAACILIGAELLAACGLLQERKGALLAMTLMLLLFVGVLSYGVLLGLDVDCGCFGPNDPEALAFHDLRAALLRDVLLLVAIGYLYLWRFVNHLETRSWFGFLFCQKHTGRNVC